MADSPLMTSIYIIFGLAGLGYTGWRLAGLQFTGGKCEKEMNDDELKKARQQGLITGGKRRRKTKRQRHYKNQSIRK